MNIGDRDYTVDPGTAAVIGGAYQGLGGAKPP